MDSIARATAVLVQAEASLRDLVSEAAAVGDYAGVMQIAPWASTISGLVNRARAGASGSSLSKTSPSKSGGSRLKTPASKRDGVQANSQDDYPRFLRRGDRLIRVSWSKREKKEYQHKAPHAVLQSLVDAMLKFGADGCVFSTDDFLPLHDADGVAVPAYQAYVGISLLKHFGLIDQQGRQGYSIPRLSEFEGAVDAVWKNLPNL